MLVKPSLIITSQTERIKYMEKYLPTEEIESQLVFFVDDRVKDWLPQYIRDYCKNSQNVNLKKAVVDTFNTRWNTYLEYMDMKDAQYNKSLKRSILIIKDVAPMWYLIDHPRVLLLDDDIVIFKDHTSMFQYEFAGVNQYILNVVEDKAEHLTSSRLLGIDCSKIYHGTNQGTLILSQHPKMRDYIRGIYNSTLYIDRLYRNMHKIKTYIKKANLYTWTERYWYYFLESTEKLYHFNKYEAIIYQKSLTERKKIVKPQIFHYCFLTKEEQLYKFISDKFIDTDPEDDAREIEEINQKRSLKAPKILTPFNK
jgi:hypothetical protein